LLLGGSRFQIGGPAGAFIVLVAATMAEPGRDGLILATFLSGLMLAAIGVLRLGGQKADWRRESMKSLSSYAGFALMTTKRRSNASHHEPEAKPDRWHLDDSSHGQATTLRPGRT
jgi:hypothetical protein